MKATNVNRYAADERWVSIKAFWLEEGRGLQGIEQYEYFEL